MEQITVVFMNNWSFKALFSMEENVSTIRLNMKIKDMR